MEEIQGKHPHNTSVKFLLGPYTILCVVFQSLLTLGCRPTDLTLFQWIRAHLISIVLTHLRKFSLFWTWASVFKGHSQRNCSWSSCPLQYIIQIQTLVAVNLYQATPAASHPHCQVLPHLMPELKLQALTHCLLWTDDLLKEWLPPAKVSDIYSG